jgi:putative endonuclease
MPVSGEYSVYLVRCRDGSLYTGIATNVSRRLSEHEEGKKGAKYLRGKGPLQLVYQREIGNRSLATRIEHRIKQLPSTEKQDLGGLQARIDAMLGELLDQ